MLTVPAPHLSYRSTTPGLADLEQPVTVTVGAVRNGNTVQTPAQLESAGILIYLRPVAGGTEVWDPTSGQGGDWTYAGAAVQPLPLAYFPTEPEPWKAIAVAGTGPRFDKAASGYPNYFVRARFGIKHGPTVLGPASPSVRFVGAAERKLIAIGPAEGESPEDATQCRVQLKGPGLQVIGALMITRTAAGAEVALSNSAGAAVVLRSDGAIELRPAAGKNVMVAGDVLVNGDLHTNRINYLAADGSRKFLE